MLTLYGIPNCNTVKKARVWLEENEVAYTFHDFKKKGVDADKIGQWMEQVPWTELINKAGTTWKRLTEEEKLSVQTPSDAAKMMMERTSMIKRPIIEDEQGVIRTRGFSEEVFKKAFL
ncbi:Spx/MgsR family transcriptional regulator [Dyadobacter jejuensis]|uniref:Spx/MgsR family transcriptional regulator n=1 Tax=Dyadobacter jejuensis TaxID=1082580 RepID=A0A316AK57_9BACT|nr:Spx/MgsR family RNA polymerase-binding regulatory protein [Dyadobacter jejuensis]PWJ58195.1 Spx/MgsR family transcriptional regulator [Dyadobacter jejuensis]